MKYRVEGTTILHGEGDKLRMYVHGEVVEMPKEVGDQNPHLVPEGKAQDDEEVDGEIPKKGKKK